MLNLGAFSGRDLQHMRTILQKMIDDEVSVADALMGINSALSIRMTTIVTGHDRSSLGKSVCPFCGSLLSPAAPIEGLVRMGCQKCRYSKIISEAK